MAVTNTPRFGLTLFSAGTDPFVTRGQYDADMQAVELLAAQFLQGTLSQFQGTAPGTAGRVFKVVGDAASNNGRMFYDDGAAWTEVATMAPASLAVLRDALIPVGELAMFATDTVPAGWLYADGSLHATAQYPLLFAYLGINWARPGNQFQVPDYRGDLLIGRAIGTGPATGTQILVAQHAHSFSVVSGTEQAGGPGQTGTHTHPQTTPGGGSTGPEATAHVHTVAGDTQLNYASFANPATVAIKAA